jgi:hypothetical protein
MWQQIDCVGDLRLGSLNWSRLLWDPLVLDKLESLQAASYAGDFEPSASRTRRLQLVTLQLKLAISVFLLPGRDVRPSFFVCGMLDSRDWTELPAFGAA